MEKDFEKILKLCENGTSNIDHDQIRSKYFDYLELIPDLANTKYMLAEKKESDPYRLVFFTEENIIIAPFNGTCEVFPIKGRITNVSILEVKFTVQDRDRDRQVWSIRFSFRTDLGLDMILEETEPGKKRSTYLVRILQEYILPNLKKD